MESGEHHVANKHPALQGRDQTAAAVGRRTPNRITYPLIVIGVLGLPWLARPVTGWH